MLRKFAASPLVRISAVVGLIAGALLLAMMGQRQLQAPNPNVITGLASLVVAAWLLSLLRQPSGTLSSVGSLPALLLFGVSGFLLLTTVYLHTLPPRAWLLLTTWVLGMLAFFAGCWVWDRSQAQAQPLNLDWRRSDTIFVVAALLVAGLFRFAELGRVPLTMSGDEGNMAMEAVRINAGTIKDPFTTGWLSHPTLWFYLQALSIKLFGETMAGVRMLSALLGSLTIASTYVLGRLLFTRRIAMVAALLLATYHMHIHFSRFALNNVADPFWGTLIISAWVIALRTKRMSAYGAAGLGLGLALYFYHGARLFIPLLLVLGVLYVLPRWRAWRSLRTKKVWIPLLVVVGGLLVAGGPIMQTFANNPGEFMARVNLQRWTSQDIAAAAQATGRSKFSIIMEQVRRSFLAFNAYTDTSTFYDETRPLLWGLAAALLIIGILIALSQFRRLSTHVLLVWFVLAILIGGVMLRNPPNSPRYVTLAPVVCLLIALAIDYLVSALDTVLPEDRRALVGSILAGAITVYLGVSSVNSYFRDYIQREHIGGVNTHVAMALATYIKDQPEGTQLWFMVPPRMFYHGFAMLDYLARQVKGDDVLEKVTTPETVPPASAGKVTIYAITPERLDELNLVKLAYPGGEEKALYWPLEPEPLIYVYRLDYRNFQQ